MEEMERIDPEFDMSEPYALDGWGERFAFRLNVTEPYLLEFVRTLLCVSDVRDLIESDSDDWSLVEIDNEFDPDEAWHWVRTELEDEVNNSGLDAMWREAIWLL